ncbi:1 concanamycin induced protein c [Mycena sanguinolenta]|uniref:1 concanamycin induced protein c n=1 Tax=Mycena sanguinolenta TaxID=230812 RepID=A0A8H7D2P7_9AGAR|nr:1 concanamycin induced protein c [Mycena sanguinolenta]
MGWFSHDSDEAAAAQQFADTDASSPHKASMTHELIAAAAAYEAAKAYEKHCKENGQPESHAKAKEIMAALTAGFIDREVETKGVSAAVSFRCGALDERSIPRFPVSSWSSGAAASLPFPVCPPISPIPYLPVPNSPCSLASPLCSLYPFLLPSTLPFLSLPSHFRLSLTRSLHLLDFIDKEEAKRQAHQRNEQMLKDNWDSY